MEQNGSQEDQSRAANQAIQEFSDDLRVFEDKRFLPSFLAFNLADQESQQDKKTVETKLLILAMAISAQRNLTYGTTNSLLALFLE